MRSRNHCDHSIISSDHQQSSYSVQAELKLIKSPYLLKVEEAKKRFQTVKRNFQQSNMRELSPEEQITLNNRDRQSQGSQQTVSNTPRSPQRLFTDLSNDEPIYPPKKTSLNLAQWKLRKQTTFFNKKSQLLEKFSAVFERKTIQPHNWSGDTFKLAQKQLIQRIFIQIGDKNAGNVTFQAIEVFFKGCPLFYQIYNIHPNSLNGVLAEAAHHYETRLTQEEFMNLFLINNRSVDDFNSFGQIQEGRRCILGQQSWTQMKQIFDALDTFGESKVMLTSFLRRLKALPNKHLLSQPCLYFPPVNRSYFLSKIVNQLELKSNIGESQLSWEELVALINNFQPIPHPTIDILAQKSISTAQISKNTNIFMLRQQALEFLKQVFVRSPKYCHYFVELSHFCQDIYEACEFKMFEQEIIRNDASVVKFAQAVASLRACSLKYMDLDEVLEWFAIKQTLVDEPHKSKKLEFEQLSSDDQCQTSNKKDAKQSKKPKSSQQKYSGLKYEARDLTKIEQFCLSKQKQTIRQKRLKQMLDQKDAEERKQCSKKFKANPIPSSTNQQKYQQYKQKMYKKKYAILSSLQKQNQRQNFVIQYLSANTKLFEKKKTVQAPSIQRTPFEPKPVPWFVHPNLLAQIQGQKRERQQIQRRKNQLKYLKQWKNLPSFLQQMNIISEINIAKSPSKIINDEKVKIKQIPDFNELHRRFQLELQRKRQFFKPTKISQFNLTSPKNKKIVEPIKPSPTPKQNTTINQMPNNFIGSTLKYEASVKLRLQKKQRENERIKLQKQTKKERKKAQKQFANYMRNQLKKQVQLNLSTSKIGSNSVRTQKEYKKQMAELYQRVFSRPFLFQSNSQKAHQDHSSKAQRIDLGQTISDLQWHKQLPTQNQAQISNKGIKSSRKSS